MDTVSDVLRALRLNGAVYLNAEFTAPWCVIGETDSALCAAYLPSSERVVSYHLIIEGSCWARLASNPASAIHVTAGELLVVPQGEANILGSTLDAPPTPLAPLLAGQLETAPGEMMKLCHGGGGAPVHIICGFLACDETLTNPLISALPRLFKIDMRNDPRSAWLHSSLQFAGAEAAQWRAGSATIVAKLSELLFAEAVRRCINALPADRDGWLAGVTDRFIGRALSMMHGKPASPWTVGELARRTGLSRSAFAQRFNDLLGEPPMQYLTRWRLQVAAKELSIGDKPLAVVAVEVGYESEAAFSRAFKRQFGMPPASWRKCHGADTTAERPPGSATVAA